MNRILRTTVMSMILSVTLTFGQIEHHDVNLVTTSPWAENSWHRIGPNCTVENGTLVIGDNVLVDFYRGDSIKVLAGGTIDATDEGGDPIVFTSAGDTAEAGFWEALIAEGSSGNPATMILNNCEIRYGGEVEGRLDYEDGVVQCVGYTTLTARDCYIHDNLGSGISSRHNGNNNLTIEDCVIDICDIGIKCLTTATTGSMIRRNLITECDLGMRLYSNSLAKIVNNVIQSSIDTGVVAIGGTEYFKFNVIDGSGDDGIYLYVDISYSTIENNIIVNNGNHGIAQVSGSGSIQYNNVWNNTNGNYYYCSAGTGAISTDPKFTAAYGGDNYYHLKWDSPCLGEGDDTYSNSNPAVSDADMGAYGGPYLDPGLALGIYWVNITGGGISNTTLDQDASPYTCAG